MNAIASRPVPRAERAALARLAAAAVRAAAREAVDELERQERLEEADGGELGGDGHRGDPARVVIIGWSRGAIATGAIGLHDEATSSLFKAFVPYSHLDGDCGWVDPDTGADPHAALAQRWARLGGRPPASAGRAAGLARRRTGLRRQFLTWGGRSEARAWRGALAGAGWRAPTGRSLVWELTSSVLPASLFRPSGSACLNEKGTSASGTRWTRTRARRSRRSSAATSS